MLHAQVEYVEGEEDALPLKERSMDCKSFFMKRLEEILIVLTSPSKVS